MSPKRARKPLRPDAKAACTNAGTAQGSKAQQDILNVFRNSFADTIGPDLKGKIQCVKSALYERDFTKVFGSEQNLEAYAVRWSPSRALAYSSTLKTCLETYLRCCGDDPAKHGIGDEPLRVLSLGGGAGAELVAAAAVLESFEGNRSSTTAIKGLHLIAVDIASWSVVLRKLYDTMTVPTPVSKYAAAHVVAANTSFVDPNSYNFTFHQNDVLGADFDLQLEERVRQVDLVTCFFTMNELFSTSISATNRLILRLKDTMQLGSFMLVVDSAGSYATVVLNDSDKSYPMQWLLDHAMHSKEQSSDSGKVTASYEWIKVMSEDSTWFRIPEGLKYPLELENMRYQLHLYQKRAKT